ncbi:MAG: hypothetical protein PHF84_07355 [bacterium]|nr:hypothetical protein [bacterium]
MSHIELNESERAELIRKGNQLFNSGKIKEAARVFETVKYGDGLIRIANHYYKKKEMVQAILYYKKAGYTKPIEALAPEIIMVLKTWLDEGQ